MNSGDAKRLGEEAARRLARAGQYDIGPGLTDAEFARIEEAYEFEFAADHRAFLAAGLPLNRPAPGGRGPWPDWRDAAPGDLRERLGWPVEGALFDVEHNALWHPSWGQRPAGTSEALTTARRHLSRAPKMIPVCSHRYLPAGRGTYGHPVLSIYQADIIVYGTDLADYIDQELGLALHPRRLDAAADGPVLERLPLTRDLDRGWRAGGVDIRTWYRPPEATTTTREIQLPLDSRGWRTATTRRPSGRRQPSSFRSARSWSRPATPPQGPSRR